MAWNDIKSTNDELPASEWNDHVTDQESRLKNIVEDTTPELGGYLDAGAHGIGFTLNTITSNTINWTLGNKAAATLTANSTLYFIAPTKPSNLLFVITQNTTGTGNSITWPTIRWTTGVAPTLTTGTSKSDIISLFYNGSQYFGTSTLNF